MVDWLPDWIFFYIVVVVVVLHNKFTKYNQKCWPFGAKKKRKNKKNIGRKKILKNYFGFGVIVIYIHSERDTNAEKEKS